jgi:hypothetical protein
MKRWRVDVTPVNTEDPLIVEIPASVGTVRVIHVFTAGGSGTVESTYDTYENALADTQYSWDAVITAGVADIDTDVLGVHVQAVRLTSATTDQRFLLVGEDSAD